jgi:hypothetical protein
MDSKAPEQNHSSLGEVELKRTSAASTDQKQIQKKFLFILCSVYFVNILLHYFTVYFVSCSLF